MLLMALFFGEIIVTCIIKILVNGFFLLSLLLEGCAIMGIDRNVSTEEFSSFM